MVKNVEADPEKTKKHFGSVGIRSSSFGLQDRLRGVHWRYLPKEFIPPDCDGKGQLFLEKTCDAKQFSGDSELQRQRRYSVLAPGFDKLGDEYSTIAERKGALGR